MSESYSVADLHNFLQKRGSGALEKARKLILSDAFECKVIEEALQYFITEYWHDYTTPTLIFLACEAVGSNAEHLEDIASAIILINGAIDIHDDIIDLSKQKDGRQTIYGKFGKEVALLVGNALFIRGFLKLVESCRSFGPETTKKVLDTLKTGFYELGEAEVLELKLRHRLDVNPEEYLKVIYKKAADIEALMRIGAILGNANPNDVEMLGRLGRIIGLLSIIRDDIIDMTLWKELNHRIKYECLPLPLLYALNDHVKKVDLIKLLNKRDKRKNEFKKLCQLTQDAKGFEETLECMGKMLREGQMISNKLQNSSQHLNLILKSLLMIEELKI